MHTCANTRARTCTHIHTVIFWLPSDLHTEMIYLCYCMVIALPLHQRDNSFSTSPLSSSILSTSITLLCSFSRHSLTSLCSKRCQRNFTAAIFSACSPQCTKFAMGTNSELSISTVQFDGLHRKLCKAVSSSSGE